MATGLQLILWHDTAAGHQMRWSHSFDEGGGTVDIAAQMKATLKHADANQSND